MKYFVCFFVLSLFLCACFSWQHQKKYIQSTFIKKILLKKYNSNKTDTFFSLFADEIIEMAAAAVLSAPSKVKRHLFKSFKQGHENELFKYLKQNEAPLFAVLDALLTKKTYTPKKTKGSTSKFSKLAAMLGFESQFEYQLPDNLFKKSPFFFSNKRLNCLSKLFEARCLFLKTDLKKSSEILIKLAIIYQKQNNAFKTAYTYFMLGQVYSLSKAFDTAHLIFEKALHIFNKTHCSYGQHLVLTAIALNFMCQQNYKEAHTYFKQAHTFFHKTENILLEAKTLNGQSCCHLNNNNFKKAHQIANFALKLHQKIGNRYGMAFSLEIQAAANSSFCRHRQAIFQAKSALKHYRFLQNPTAEQKMLYMLTKIYLNAGELQNAKKILNTYIKHKTLHQLPSFEDEKTLKEIINPPEK